jgi:hypothetical protein
MKYLLVGISRYYLWFLMLALLPVMSRRVEPNLRGVIWSDAEGYYVYLPAVFNLGDVHAVPAGSMNARTNPAGETVIKYTCGVAMFQMPLFLVARAWSDREGLPRTDIYNRHYARAVAFTGFFVGFLGLFFLQQALKRRGFSDWIVAATVLATLGGTNLFYYMTKEMGMSHAYSFCLFALLAWRLPTFYERPNWRSAAMLGAILGWIVLIRPTNIVALLFVLLFDVYTWRDFTARLRFLYVEIRYLLLSALVGFCFLVPQLLYWRSMTGQWVRYSYEGEGFPYWSRPKIAAVLMDPQNGLFLYSPLVLLSVIGAVIGWRRKAWHGMAVTLIFGISTYVFASWWAWWFGGAFGHRSYVELYALMAFPLAGLFSMIQAWGSPILRGLTWILIGFLVYYSVQLSFLYTRIGNPWDGPDWRWNWDKMRWIWKHLFDFG